MLKAIFAAALLGLAAISPALAEPVAQRHIRVSFKDMDRNFDGRLSHREIRRFFPEVKPEDFAKADKDGDGRLDRPELAASTLGGQKSAPKSIGLGFINRSKDTNNSSVVIFE